MPGYFELDSIVQISKTIQDVREYFNPQIALACFLYTSGPPGPSKCCMLPHNYLVTLSDQLARMSRRRADDVVLTPLPLFHLAALTVCVVGTLLVGGRASIGRRFSVSGFWPEVKRTGATIISGLG